jgi:hypothetical protein
LRQGDSFAIGGVDGFKYRDLEHAEWMTPAPKDVSKKNATVNHFIAL